MGRPHADGTPAKPAAKRKPQISVIERRKLDPGFRDRASIELNTPGMRLRWGNAGIPNRHHELTRGKGWTPVTRDQLVSPEEIGDLTDNGDGLVRRGERGREILYCMPEKDYEEIKMAETHARMKRDKNVKAVRSDMAQAAAAKMGAEAGDFLAGEHSGTGLPIRPLPATIQESVERLDGSE